MKYQMELSFTVPESEERFFYFGCQRFLHLCLKHVVALGGDY
jgi:hypothetical protein